MELYQPDEGDLPKPIANVLNVERLNAFLLR